MVFVIGQPINIRKLIQDAGGDPDAPSREVALEVAEQVRQIMQGELNAAVAEHGSEPYKWKQWWHAMKAIKKYPLAAWPTGWPYLFLQHARNLERPPAKNRLHAFLRDWDIMLFYVPLGWIFIALARALRKPPYGYRGLSHQAWMKKTGSYLWLLEKRPIATRPQDRTAQQQPIL
jgi:hypothetical protein